ncbi:hypothetical protein FF38_02254, partial [Lucilia cuprina]
VTRIINEKSRTFSRRPKILTFQNSFDDYPILKKLTGAQLFAFENVLSEEKHSQIVGAKIYHQKFHQMHYNSFKYLYKFWSYFIENKSI